MFILSFLSFFVRRLVTTSAATAVAWPTYVYHFFLFVRCETIQKIHQQSVYETTMRCGAAAARLHHPIRARARRFIIAYDSNDIAVVFSLHCIEYVLIDIYLYRMYRISKSLPTRCVRKCLHLCTQSTYICRWISTFYILPVRWRRKKRKPRIKDSANKPYRTAYVDEYINMERKIYTLVLVSCGWNKSQHIKLWSSSCDELLYTHVCECECYTQRTDE